MTDSNLPVVAPLIPDAPTILNPTLILASIRFLCTVWGSMSYEDCAWGFKKASMYVTGVNP